MKSIFYARLKKKCLQKVSKTELSLIKLPFGSHHFDEPCLYRFSEVFFPPENHCKWLGYQELSRKSLKDDGEKVAVLSGALIISRKIED